MNKKFISFLFVLVLIMPFAYSKAADFDWCKGNTNEKTWFKSRKKGVSSLSIGGLVGYPEIALAIRYRGSDNRIRLMGTVGFDYGNSLAIPSQKSSSRDWHAFMEYVLFKIPVGGKKDPNKLWNIDIAPSAGLGFYKPIDDPSSPSDYYAFLLSLGLNASLDLPYSDAPFTFFMRYNYRSALPIVKNHFLYVGRHCVDIGFTWHIVILSGGEKYKNGQVKTQTKKKITTTKKVQTNSYYDSDLKQSYKAPSINNNNQKQKATNTGTSKSKNKKSGISDSKKSVKTVKNKK